MICSLCKEDKALIKAHILPRWSYMYLYSKDRVSNSRPLIIIGKKRNKNSPIGIYDKSILCSGCDTFLGNYDSYGKKVFQDSELTLFKGSNVAYIIKDVDIKRLSVFLLSVLWRCSISEREEFASTNLGPYEKKIWNILILAKKGKCFEKELDKFDFIITRFGFGNFPDLTNRNMHLPITQRVSSINFYALYLPRGFKIYIKVDKRDLDVSLKKVQMKSDELLVPTLDDFETSHEFLSMREMVRKNKRR